MFNTTRTIFRPTFRRMFSGDAHDAEHHALTQTWRKRTLLALPVIGALGVYNVGVHLSHGHHESHKEHPFAYEKKFLKKYPWEASECNLFDYDCKKHHFEAAKGGKKGGH